ncbi:DUF2064 domain-containing protein [Streptomyces thermocoprophilus]
MTTLLVIAKEPRPGRVKTRLTPPYSPTRPPLSRRRRSRTPCGRWRRRPPPAGCWCWTGGRGPWLPPGFDVVPQCGGGLDERLAAAFAACTGPALLIGMDTPQVTPDLLTLEPDGCDAWFGPAEDGGFWALGLASPDPELLRGVPMSRPDTGARQRARLVEAGLRVRDLPLLRDVDTAADADAVAASAPDGRFAAELARVRPGVRR